MKTHPLTLITIAYFVELAIVVYLTRATPRRVLGALVGGVAVAFASLGMVAFCVSVGWWRMPIASTPFLAAMLGIGIVISCSPLYLVTWRIGRRFGLRGLVITTTIVTIIGMPRDYFIAAKFPEWMVFLPGAAPIVADGVAYAVIMIVGHAVMYLVAGPSRADPLARRVHGVRSEV
ncbi:MAG TPA: hypothetical protein VHX14_15235 [Thermoanaerobaculia bacterium]|jgi:hypothetical protein|nr:hypothetical protein [Thermoanaerobaculia bacterium]